ncbi:MAG: hypothetical protein Q8P90_05615 [bacterium]|nr:hypothetical protein [bacterium]
MGEPKREPRLKMPTTPAEPRRDSGMPVSRSREDVMMQGARDGDESAQVSAGEQRAALITKIDSLKAGYDAENENLVVAQSILDESSKFSGSGDLTQYEEAVTAAKQARDEAYSLFQGAVRELKVLDKGIMEAINEDEIETDAGPSASPESAGSDFASRVSEDVVRENAASGIREVRTSEAVETNSLLEEQANFVKAQAETVVQLRQELAKAGQAVLDSNSEVNIRRAKAAREAYAVAASLQFAGENWNTAYGELTGEVVPIAGEKMDANGYPIDDTDTVENDLRYKEQLSRNLDDPENRADAVGKLETYLAGKHKGVSRKTSRGSNAMSPRDARAAMPHKDRRPESRAAQYNE